MTDDLLLQAQAWLDSVVDEGESVIGKLRRLRACPARHARFHEDQEDGHVRHHQEDRD